MPTHILSQPVSFGDCDPAGIVFYPRFFAWFDRCFHDWLRGYGGHAALCARLGAVGIGLISVDAAFRSPARDGDLLEVAMEIRRWGGRSLTLDYTLRCGARLVATGTEVRGLFLRAEGGVAGDITGGEIAALERILGGGGADD